MISETRMIKPKYIAALAAIVIIIAIFYHQQEAGASEAPEKEPVEDCTPPAPTPMDSLIFTYDSLLSRRIDSMGSVGAAVVVTHGNDIAYLKTFGVRKAGTKAPVNKHTLFRLASVSKTISGVLAGILSADSLVILEDKVIDYLPGFRLRDSLSTHTMTVQHLLSHTSGLVPHAYDNMVEAGVPLQTILDSLFRVNISGAPGSLYGYQNVMFSLYDTLSRVKTQTPFETLLQKRVFEPFRMPDASAGYTPFAMSHNKAFPHVRYSGVYRALPLNDRYYNTLPAAGINASISDMAQFLLALQDSTSMPPAVLQEVLTPRVRSPLRWIYLRKWGKVESKHYALGWRIIGYHQRKIAYHGGYVQGYKAEVAFCPEEKLGMAFLTNSPNGVASGTVPLLLDLYFDRFQQEETVHRPDTPSDNPTHVNPKP